MIADDLDYAADRTVRLRIPSLWTIRRNDADAGRRPHEDERIPEDDARALVAAWAGVGDARDERIAVELARRVRRNERWIACGCRADEGVYPILAAAWLPEAKTYYLRRLTGEARANHDRDCPFRFERKEGSASSPTRVAQVWKAPAGYFSAVGPEDADSFAPHDRTPSRPGGGVRGPSLLARLAWRLMAQAGLNRVVIPGERPSIREEFAAIKSAAERIDVSRDMALARVLGTFPDDYRRHRIHARIRAAAKSLRAAGPDLGDDDEDDPRQPLQGFLALYVREATGKALICDEDEPILVDGRVETTDVGDADARRPYLALVSVAERAGGDLAALRAFAQPVYSGGRLFPVDGQPGRLALRRLIHASARLCETDRNLRIEIVKPLFPEIVDELPVRPDFRIEILDRSTGEVADLCVDVLGVHDPDTERAKERARDLLGARGPVLTIRPDVLTDPKAIEEGFLESLRTGSVVKA